MEDIFKTLHLNEPVLRGLAGATATAGLITYLKAPEVFYKDNHFDVGRVLIASAVVGLITWIAF